MTTTISSETTKEAKAGTGFHRMKAHLGPSKLETLRQKVLSDQTKARAETISSVKKTAKSRRSKTKKKAKGDIRKITVLAKSNPHAAGSRRSGWFKQLKTGMTVEGALEAGLSSIYLKRMAARRVLRIA